MVANSSPMTPAPRIRMLLGISASVTASSELRILMLSRSNPGNDTGSDPVAMTKLSAKSCSARPSCFFTRTLLASMNSTSPVIESTLLTLNSVMMPFTRSSTILDFHWLSLGRLICGAPPKSMPMFAASRAAAMTSPTCSSALLGMQPQFRQTPPTRSRSMHSTLFFSCANRMAALYPPGPPPMTIASYFVGMLLAFHQHHVGRRQLRSDVFDELRCDAAVDDAVVERDREIGHHAHDDLAVAHDRTRLDRVRAQDADFGP